MARLLCLAISSKLPTWQRNLQSEAPAQYEASLTNSYSISNYDIILHCG